MTPEGRVKEKVKKALELLPTSRFKPYRFMPVQNGMGAPSLDFLYCIAGRFVAIETKVPGKHMTPRQEITAAAIRDAGGLVFEIHDDAEIETMVARLCLMLEFDTEIADGPRDRTFPDKRPE